MVLLIDPEKYILFDASVLISAFNKLDSNHKKAIAYINNMPSNKKILLPCHALFEMMAGILRGREVQNMAYESFEAGELKIEYDNIAITQELADKIRDANLFDLFKKLKGGDLIYACIAKLYSLEFVTFDRTDFQPYEKVIRVTIP